jgi:hypothetical protein
MREFKGTWVIAKAAALVSFTKHPSTIRDIELGAFGLRAASNGSVTYDRHLS